MAGLSPIRLHTVRKPVRRSTVRDRGRFVPYNPLYDQIMTAGDRASGWNLSSVIVSCSLGIGDIFSSERRNWISAFRPFPQPV
jgi:hypothetical protein